MQISRRRIIRAAGVSLALPSLDVFRPKPAYGESSKVTPRRMVCICAPLGFHPADFFPQKTGRDYELSPYLELLRGHREDFSVISGLSGISGGHQAIDGFLTGISGAGQPGIRNGISVDQFAAQHIGDQTRFSSLALSEQGLGLSWTRTGARVPAHTSPARLFAEMFLEGSADQRQAKLLDLQQRRSVLDDVREQANSMRATLGKDDRNTLDEYLESIRELEQRLVIDEQWVKTPKPTVAVDPPNDISNKSDLIGRTKLLFDLTHLAIQTDSTRLITIMLSGTTSSPPIEGVTLGHHDLSHHGKDPGKLAQLRIIESECLKVFHDLVAKLKRSREGDATLLDRTMVYLGSNLGDASSHSTKNLPILLAGGGFQHGRHLAFTSNQAPPLCNLYVSMLQRLGIEVDTFNSGTGTLSGLLPKS
ncbi:MAG: DUF1552 domain-containing protein [Rubripirellula sp.]|jgi:hypothetical protein|nr:DUF1552 domain-containing protein [Planctomycetaceae bacterium]MDF1841388.1 DUF1552 domain-containing protein [Rubripirellula sp.]